MASLLEELKKEEALERKQPFGFVFQFLEMEILSYEKQQEMLTEQEGLDKEEAILNEQVTLSGVKKRKRRKGVKNLRFDAMTKKEYFEKEVGCWKEAEGRATEG
uniref:Uncharacterized protein n=1 Tax=Micrurus corallinus TaxID=54390 RepID=A0A2D4FNF5_MICCO